MSALIIILNIIIGITAVFLILLVIAQSNKGSDLGLFGGSAEMVFGSGQMNAVNRITMICALIMMLSVFLVGFLKSFSTRTLREIEPENQSIVISDSSQKNKTMDTPKSQNTSRVDVKEVESKN